MLLVRPAAGRRLRRRRRWRQRAAERSPGTSSFMVFGDPEELQAYRDVIAAYKNEQPDVNVKLIEASDRDDLIARLSTSFAGGTPPDLFLLNYRFYGQFAARGRARADRIARRRLRGLRAGRLLRAGDGRVPLQRHAHLPAAEHLEPGRLLQQGPVPGGRRRRAEGRLDLGRHGRRGEEADDENGRRASDQYGLGVEASIIRWPRSSGRTAASIVDDDDNPTRFTLDTPEAQEAMTRLLRPARVHDGHPDRRGGRVRGRRDPLHQRAHGDGALVAARDADVPDDHEASTGTSPRSRSTRSRPASSTPTRTA